MFIMTNLTMTLLQDLASVLHEQGDIVDRATKWEVQFDQLSGESSSQEQVVASAEIWDNHPQLEGKRINNGQKEIVEDLLLFKKNKFQYHNESLREPSEDTFIEALNVSKDSLGVAKAAEIILDDRSHKNKDRPTGCSSPFRP